jgi:RHS repeat-associated protein
MTVQYADQRYYASNFGRFMSPDPYEASAGPKDPGSWNRYTYTRGDPINRADPWGTDDVPIAVVNVVTYVNNWDQFFALYTLMVLGGGNGSPSQTEKGHRYNTTSAASVLYGLYENDVLALTAYKNAFAKELTSGDIPAPCAADMKALGITGTQWANALTSAQLLDGIGSTVPLASILPAGSLAQQTALQRNLTVGGDFGPSTGNYAEASVNGPQVWINPYLVNPGNFAESSALIAHEVLHNLGLLDSTIQTDLGLPVTPLSKNIGDKIQADCFPGPSAIPLQ